MQATTQYQPIYQFNRGHVVESIHYGAIAVMNAAGELVAWYGDPSVVTYMRSSSKPLQALPFIEAGGHQAYHLTLKEIAVMCASHSGTDEHVETVRSILAKSGAREDDLMCGVHPLSHKPTVEAMQARGETVSQIRNNCSGKHAGMLAYARLLDPAGPAAPAYLDLEHPVQKHILQTVCEMFNLEPEQVELGVDGCSAPNFAVPLCNAALALARLCDPANLPARRAEACQTLTTAMMAHPNMVGGPESFDTHLMQAFPNWVVCKTGAEGFQVLGIMPGALGPNSPAFGVAFKISDGDLKSHTRPVEDPHGRVRPAVALEILRQLGLEDAAASARLAEYGPDFPVKNLRKILVGTAQPSFTLVRPS
ncbi:MAG TPA: asparaginase [Anaerolineales bacterium]|nr:asparaginase [Anaerolineales bacterium]